MSKRTKTTAFRLTAYDKALLVKMAAIEHRDMVDVVSQALRDKAERAGVTVTESEIEAAANAEK